MRSKSIERTVLSIPYCRFLAGRLRLAILRRLELRAEHRSIRLFTLDNDVIGRRVRAQGTYETEVLAAINMIASEKGRGSGVALDIGANIGNHAISMAGAFRKVVAFEPHPVMAAALRANALLNACENLEVKEVALGSTTAVGILRQLQVDHSGMLELEMGGKAPEGNVEPGEVAVALRRGDEVLDETLESDECITLIKIDVEGAELQALHGLSSYLQRDRPVVCFEVRNPSEGRQVRAYLEGLGYREFQEIQASRVRFGSLCRLLARAGRLKCYRLSSVEMFEDRHYPAVFAFVPSAV